MKSFQFQCPYTIGTEEVSGTEWHGKNSWTSMDAGGQGSFQVGQTAKARSGYRVQSLRKGHGRQRFSSEELTNHSPAAGK